MPHKYGLTTWVLVIYFFLENGKNLGRSDDAKRKKKEDGRIGYVKSLTVLLSLVELLFSKREGLDFVVTSTKN